MLTLISARDPCWGDEAHTQIRCSVLFKEHAQLLPFNAMADDPEPHGRDLWQRLNRGEFGPVAPHVAPAPQRNGVGPRVVG
jgi:hypothetical protein